MPRLNTKFNIVEEAQVTLMHNSPSFSALAASSALSIKFLALLVICGNLAYQFLTTFCSINNKAPSDLTKTHLSPSPPPPNSLHHHTLPLSNLPRHLRLSSPPVSRPSHACLTGSTIIWKGKQTLRVRRSVRNLRSL